MNRQSTHQNPHEWDYRNNPDRWIDHRRRHLETITGFETINCAIIASAELDISHNEMAAHIGTTISAVKARLRELDDRDSMLLVERRPDELAVESPAGIAGTGLGGHE